MDRGIAVICASPPGLNRGMDSVDRALLYLADKHGFRKQLSFYRLYPSAPVAPQTGQEEIPYSIIPWDDEFFRRQQATLYWGDFLHMRQYHETVAHKLVRLGLADSLEVARTRVNNIFLQSGQDPGTVGRTLTFGSTLIFNTVSDEMDPGYTVPLERFLRACRAAWFRDVYSAFKACLIRGSFETSCLGVDCATLFDPEQVFASEGRPAVEDQVGIFLGRTTIDAEVMARFAVDLARGLHCQPAWLRWGDADAFPALSSILKSKTVRSLARIDPGPAVLPVDASAGLLKYRAIVTDTYHVCVNAWNMGVPAICLVEGDNSHIRNVNFGDSFARRDKRVVFMSMYDALDFLVRDQELGDRERGVARIRHLIDLVHSGREIKEIHTRIRSHANLVEKQLIQAVNGLL